MTLQLLLSIGVAVGILTLATVALMNVAGLRIHEVDKSDGQAYLYGGNSAQRLRGWFRRLPLWLGVAAAIAFAGILTAGWWTGTPISPGSAVTEAAGGVSGSPNAVGDLQRWSVLAALVAYVAVMLVVALGLSWWLYRVMQDEQRNTGAPSPSRKSLDVAARPAGPSN